MLLGSARETNNGSNYHFIPWMPVVVVHFPSMQLKRVLCSVGRRRRRHKPPSRRPHKPRPQTQMLPNAFLMIPFFSTWRRFARRLLCAERTQLHNTGAPLRAEVAVKHGLPSKHSMLRRRRVPSVRRPLLTLSRRRK